MGTELLLGQIPNTNAQEISQGLATIGVDVHFHTVVGDNHERMVDVIRRAVGRSDAVIITGGLGPTPDDITREAVAEVAGRELVRDPGLAATIREVFDKLGREMPEENLRQADVPDGATPIEIEGTAPGFILDHGGTFLCALPGVPWEMRAMLAKTVLPRLREAAGQGAIVSRQVLVVGLGESHTHKKIHDLVDRQTNPTIAYLAGGGQVRVRVTAKAATEAEAAALIAPVEQEIRARLGDSAVAGGEADLGTALSDLLRARRLKVAVAESLTGGAIGAELTHHAGSSDVFVGGLIVYTNEAKKELAGVPASTLEEHGAVSAQTAEALARGAAERSGAELGLSATGVAGPAEQEGKPAGLFFVSAYLQGSVATREVRGYGDRANIRALAVTSALDLGRRLVLGS